MEIYKKEECCGCTACKFACPVHAIDMRIDRQGFSYPEIDEEKCINCGTCKRICPWNSQENMKQSRWPDAYAVINNDEVVRGNSSSGGAFYRVAQYILQRGGIVYGVVFDDEFRVTHVRGTCTEDVIRMQRAKYVQSDLKNIFELVKNDLLDNRDVLFTGCPCQVDGLKHYLKGCKQERLITCDLICHGVNSPKIWMDYLSYRKKKNDILSINFRNKSKGWRTNSMHIQMNRKDYLVESSYDCFFQAFYSGVSLRPSCFSCKYARLNRIADITLGDFWGIERIFPELDDNKGVSLVLINSNKGKELFLRIEESFTKRNVEADKCLQPSLESPRIKPKQYEQFWSDYFSKSGFALVRRKYLNDGIKGKIKRMIKSTLIKLKLWKK
ncbi:MAG: 4Fe-4S binding protein [Lachnospiraceae bacterium]|nr:4Fe-4S binding protein [Lachnospiraceae bacterium]